MFQLLTRTFFVYYSAFSPHTGTKSVQRYDFFLIYPNKMQEKCKLFKFVLLFEAFIGGVSSAHGEEKNKIFLYKTAFQAQRVKTASRSAPSQTE